MPSGRSWTTRDERYLRDSAGHVPVSEMARNLMRSPDSVRKRLAHMGLSGRVWESRLEWCVACGAPREMGTGGTCPVCSRLATRERQVEEEARLMALLPSDSAALKRPQLLGSRVDPVPRHRSARPLTQVWEADRDADERAVEEQAWEVRQLDRENSSRRRRIERLREQLSSLGIDF